MNSGMLWFDNDIKKTLPQKIQGAVNYYIQKYGRQPDLCLVHPSMNSEPWENGGFKVGEVSVRPYRPVLPGHIWVGIEDK